MTIGLIGSLGASIGAAQINPAYWSAYRARDAAQAPTSRPTVVRPHARPNVVSTLPPARFVNQRDIRLTYATRGSASVDHVRVFVSLDGGRSWAPIEHTLVAPGTAEVTVQEEGRHDFYLVLENAAGASSPPPSAGDRPHVSAMIDTLPPTMQVHGASLERNPAGSLTARVELTLIEENLSPEGIRLFYRTDSAGEWIDAGSARYDNGEIAVGLPSDVEQADLRVVVTDMAGNRAFDEQLDVAVPEPAPVVSVEPVAAGTGNQAPKPTAVDVQAVIPALPDPSVVALRKKAAEHMQRGEYSLAAARLSEALDRSPNDADVLADLGRAAYAMRNLDEAALHYEESLHVNPDQTDALEGLALVEVRQHEYPRAKDHLEHLLRLNPKSGRMWLNYGDVLHRMGDAQQANDAWERVLKVDADRQTRENATKRLRYIGSLRDTQTP